MSMLCIVLQQLKTRFMDIYLSKDKLVGGNSLTLRFEARPLSFEFNTHISSGTDCVTTDPGPIKAFFPIEMPGISSAPAHMTA